MAHLSKGERREVERIVRQAISPEWKLLTQIHVSNQPVDATSDAKGSDIFAGITPGVGDNNRIGDSIRVKRIEIIYVVHAPATPQFNGHIPCVALAHRAASSAVTLPANIPDLFDQTVMATPLMFYGPTFMKRDWWERGIYIRKLKRFKMRGTQRQASQVYNPADGSYLVPQLSGQNGTQLGIVNNMVPAQIESYVGNPGLFHATVLEHQPDGEVGNSRVQFKQTIVYGGNGLHVTFADGTGAIIDTNRVYAMLGCGVASGTAGPGANFCPRFSRYTRVWFTDE